MKLCRETQNSGFLQVSCTAHFFFVSYQRGANYQINAITSDDWLTRWSKYMAVLNEADVELNWPPVDEFLAFFANHLQMIQQRMETWICRLIVEDESDWRHLPNGLFAWSSTLNFRRKARNVWIMTDSAWRLEHKSWFLMKMLYFYPWNLQQLTK